MKVKNLFNDNRFKVINQGDGERDINGIYCCDLLSIVMSKAPADSAWVTVMGNVNAVAVATLADLSVIVLADGAAPDAVMLEKAKSEGVNLLQTDMPIFEAATAIKDVM